MGVKGRAKRPFTLGSGCQSSFARLHRTIRCACHPMSCFVWPVTFLRNSAFGEDSLRFTEPLEKAVAVSSIISGVLMEVFKKISGESRHDFGRQMFIQCWYWKKSCSPYEGAKLQPVLDKNRAPMGPEILSVLGLGSGGRLLRHFQTPALYWINFSLRDFPSRITPSMAQILGFCAPTKADLSQTLGQSTLPQALFPPCGHGFFARDILTAFLSSPEIGGTQARTKTNGHQNAMLQNLSNLLSEKLLRVNSQHLNLEQKTPVLQNVGQNSSQCFAKFDQGYSTFLIDFSQS